jgi:hypothetical protein
MVVIPAFILKKLYVSGSLQSHPEGISFEIRNGLGPGMLTRVNRIKLDETEFLPAQITFSIDDKLIPADTISETSPAALLMNQSAICILSGASLEVGAHKITLDLSTREAGALVITIQDQYS